MTKTRKTPETWIKAGLKALPKTGPDGLRAETLSRELGTTKGSFYWHFKDVPAFHAAVLEAWQASAQGRLEAALTDADTTVTQLRALSRLRATPLDTAVRAWAAQSGSARKAVSRHDRAVLKRLEDLLSDLGATHPDFPGLVHAAIVAAPTKGSHAETLVDLLLVLK